MDDNPYRAPREGRPKFRRRRVRPMGRIVLAFFACVVAAMIGALALAGK